MQAEDLPTHDQAPMPREALDAGLSVIRGHLRAKYPGRQISFLTTPAKAKAA
jgi:hypothetical protein